MKNANDSASSPSGWLLLAAGAGYVFVPFFPLKFLCLALVVWLVGCVAASRRHVSLWVAAVLYACSFLTMPFACFLFTRPQQPSLGVLLWTQAGLILLGMAWLYLVARDDAAPPVEPADTPSVVFAGGFALLFVLLCFPSWCSELAYGGDEVFHICSIHTIYYYVYQAATPAWVLLAALAGTIGILLCLRRSNSDAAARWRLSWYGVVVLLLAALLVIMACHSRPVQMAEVMSDTLFFDRLVRYPSAETWISTLLGLLCHENWHGMMIDKEICRFLPALSLLLLGLILGSDARWRTTPVAFTILAALAVVTIPGMFFHATMVYLELPATLLTCIMLFYGQNILTGNATTVCKQGAWWAFVMIGFTKDTAMPIVLAVLLARLCAQIGCWWRRRSSLAALLRAETGMWIAALLPFTLYYLLSRYLMGVYGWPVARVYGNEFGNILNILVWWRALSELGYQFGFIMLLSVYGAWVLYRNREWEKLTLALVVFFAMKIFYLCDLDEWMSLPRHNLLAVPPIIVLAWEGMSELVGKRRQWAALVVLLLVAANLAMRPMDAKGDRSGWGLSDERWYPFYQCLQNIQNACQQGEPKILVANMVVRYAFPLITERQGWSPIIVQKPPFSEQRGMADLSLALKYAHDEWFDVVVYRNDGDIELPDRYEQHGFVKAADYRAKIGSLQVFYRKR